jgi:hypothetical protein
MTEGFRKYVSCAFGLGLDELLMGGNGIVTLPIMSEYNLFGLYLEKLGEQESGYRFIHVKEWDTETILQSWSWGGVEKSKAKMEAILGKK